MRFAHSPRASDAVRQPSSPRAAHPRGAFVSYKKRSFPYDTNPLYRSLTDSIADSPENETFIFYDAAASGFEESEFLQIFLINIVLKIPS